MKNRLVKTVRVMLQISLASFLIGCIGFMLACIVDMIVESFYNGEILIRYDYTFATILSIVILYNIKPESKYSNIIDIEE